MDRASRQRGRGTPPSWPHSAGTFFYSRNNINHLAHESRRAERSSPREGTANHPALTVSPARGTASSVQRYQWLRSLTRIMCIMVNVASIFSVTH